MHARFDKLAPGRTAKLCLAQDSIVIAALVAAFSSLRLDLLQSWAAILLTLFTWYFTSTVNRLYSPCTPRGRLDDLILGLLATIGTTAITAVTLALMGVTFKVLPFLAALFGITALSRMLLLESMRNREDPEERVLVVGTGPLARATYEQIHSERPQTRRVVGFLSLPGHPEIPRGMEAVAKGTSDDIVRILAELPVDEVYVAGRVVEHGEAMQRVVSQCEELGVPFAVPLHALRFDRATLLSAAAGRDGYLHYLETHPHPLGYSLKRFMDISAAALALGVLGPVLLATAAAIKLTSRGPVLFRQKRVGLHGYTFDMLKFRSMVTNAEELKKKLAAANEQTGPVFKMKNDPRVTSVGRFIRKFSIDELPQLVNVLRGEMTLVGPRPALPSEVALYKPWQRRRLSVRPGLTCYWQVGGRNNISFDEWMRLDLRYIDNWSIGVDLSLLWRTVPAVLAARGAS